MTAPHRFAAAFACCGGQPGGGAAPVSSCRVFQYSSGPSALTDCSTKAAVIQRSLLMRRCRVDCDGSIMHFTLRRSMLNFRAMARLAVTICAPCACPLVETWCSGQREWGITFGARRRASGRTASGRQRSGALTAWARDQHIAVSERAQSPGRIASRSIVRSVPQPTTHGPRLEREPSWSIVYGVWRRA